MATPPATLAVHSLTEAQIYIWATRCNQCGRGPVVPGIGRFEGTEAGLTIPATCRSCGSTWDMCFALGRGAADSGEVRLTTLDQCPTSPGLPINPTEEPSQVIDVAGWLTLEAMLGEKARQAAGRADNPADRAVVRQWQLLAGACAEEALKFYEDDNDLPPAEAFFSESSKAQLRERPAMFTRERLIQLRTKRPMQTIGKAKQGL